MQVESLMATNREQARTIDELSRAAAQREADNAQLQIQLAQAKLNATQTAKAMQDAHAQAQAHQRSQLVAQHNQLIQQASLPNPTFLSSADANLFVFAPATTSVLTSPTGVPETAS